ncbi:hypothetical protein SUGI_0762690 [Cryptomeria japonica]|nr:hypothetical protein SUGI_0762690 [Cryptomeria japonica]
MTASSGEVPSSLQPDPPLDTTVGPHAPGSASGTPLSADLSKKTVKNNVPSGSSSSKNVEEGKKDFQSNWKGALLGSTFATLETTLANFTQTDEGTKIKLPDSLMDKIAASLHLAIVGCFFSFRPSIDMVRQWAMARWKLKGSVDISVMPRGGYWLSQRANKEISSFGDDVNSVSSSVEGGTKWLINKLKGKMQKPLVDLLQEYDLPKGLFPQDATNYEFDEETAVTGFLEKGKLTDIEGMKTKVIIWVKVTSVSVDGPRSSKVYFTAGVKKSRPRDAYDILRSGTTVENF